MRTGACVCCVSGAGVPEPAPTADALAAGGGRARRGDCRRPEQRPRAAPGAVRSVGDSHGPPHYTNITQQNYK